MCSLLNYVSIWDLDIKCSTCLVTNRTESMFVGDKWTWMLSGLFANIDTVRPTISCFYLRLLVWKEIILLVWIRKGLLKSNKCVSQKRLL